MFTTGSKLLIGATALSVISAILFGIFVEGPTAVVAGVGMLSAAIAFGLLAGVNLYTRDSNAAAMEPGIEHTANAAVRPPSRSMWPLVAAAGVAGLAAGAVSKPVVFKVAVVVLLAAIVEWMVSAWSDRASADGTYNGSIRARLLHPLEFPVLATLGLGALIYAFSRIMLTANKDAGRWVFIILGAVLLAGAFVLAHRRGLSKRTVAGVCAVGAFAMLGVGVASAIQGQREIETHETPNDHPGEFCLEPVDEEHLDKGAPKAPSAQAAVYGTIIAKADGSLVADPAGAPGETSQLTVPRGATVSVLFRNETDEAQRLTARLGTFGEDDEELITCTTGVEPGEEGYLKFKAVNVPLASSTPMVFQLGGDDSATVEVLVP